MKILGSISSLVLDQSPLMSDNNTIPIDKLDDMNLPRFYLIVNNIAKKQNIGNVIRSACAFGVKEVLVAGSPKTTQFFGAQGTDKHVAVQYFKKYDDAIEYAKSKGCKICGIEIKDEARSILEKPFDPPENTAFVLGNEGQGLSEKQCASCDYFIYIPHYGDGTASLNVCVAGSIIFHHFAAACGYPPSAREGEKYLVKELPQKRGPETEHDMELRRQRQLKKLQKLQEEEACMSIE